MQPIDGPSIVVVGGGSGLRVALNGLRPHTRHLTAIVPGCWGVTAPAVPMFPSILQPAGLCAELAAGTLVRGGWVWGTRRGRPRRIRPVVACPVAEPLVPADPRAMHAILMADAVVLGPGAGVIPNLLPQGIGLALAHTRATRICVGNRIEGVARAGTRSPELVQELLRYLGGPHLDWALVGECGSSHEGRTSDPVDHMDSGEVPRSAQWSLRASTNGTGGVGPIRARLAQAIMDLVQRGRPAARNGGAPAGALAEGGGPERFEGVSG